MKISLNWLKDYIDIPSTPAELERILTALGLEVEGMEEILSIPGGLDGLVVGHVLTCRKHPNADRLSVTTVDIGQSEPLLIVCGAPNVAEGQKVVVATVGTTLYPSEGDSFKIKKGKIRGEVSEGMICAEDEIGLGKEHSGIIVLPAEIEIGSKVANHYDVEIDTVYDIGLTPNRSDATSHIGIAKDLLAYYRYHLDPSLSLKIPVADLNIDIQNDKTVDVVIKDHNGCPRFSGITLSLVETGPSPDWMQTKLRAIGVRPISNVVDITNYVLHEYGQPLHAYDFDKIADQKVIVQTLPSGTKFIGLDEKERKLEDQDLIICDGRDKGMCIAGVFGGLESGVNDDTQNIFLESAHFNALQLRKTSTRLQLRTDAAKVFEKGSDPAQTVAALHRAASLMCTYAGAMVSSELVDQYVDPILPKEIDVDVARIIQLIGTELSTQEIERIFQALDIEIIKKEDNAYRVSIPTNKADVTREADVIEEILRIYGFNNVPIPSRLTTFIRPSKRIDVVKLRRTLSEVLINKGFHEMMGLSLIPSAKYEGIVNYQDHIVSVNNTSNIHLDAMRPEMMMSSLMACQHNINRQQKNISLYELGRSYQQVEDQDERGFAEVEWLTFSMSGESFANWRQPARDQDFYDIKKVVNAILTRLGITSYQTSEIEDLRFAYGLKYHRGPNVIASFGAVSDVMKKAADINQDVFFAEINVSIVLQAVKRVKHESKEIPKFPSSKRDLALILDEHVAYSKIESIIKKSSGSLLKEVNLFDIYRDKKHLGEGKKSYAVSLTFEDANKNLKDKVIDKTVSKILSNLENEVGAKLR